MIHLLLASIHGMRRPGYRNSPFLEKLFTMYNKKLSQRHLSSAFLFSLLILFGLFIQAKQQPRIEPNELVLLKGNWDGTLAYKDYTTGQMDTIPVNLNAEQDDQKWILRYYYPTEPSKGWTDEYLFSADRTMINEFRLVDKQKMGEGSLKLVLEGKGKDGNEQRACTYRQEIKLGKLEFILQRYVRYDGETSFFLRNEFHLRRPALTH